VSDRPPVVTCPHCGSTDVFDTGDRHTGADGVVIASLERCECRSCGGDWYRVDMVNADA